LTPKEQVEEFRRLFRLVSQTTFRIDDVPDQAAGDQFDITLSQAGTGERLTLTFFRKDSNWFVLYPNETALVAAEAALYKRSGGKPPAEGSYRELRNPRDTMRAFLEAMDAWERGGRK